MKHHSLSGDLPEFRQAEDLEPPAVRQDRPVPAHELLDPAELAYQLVPRPQEQVIGVRQDDFRSHADEVIG